MANSSVLGNFTSIPLRPLFLCVAKVVPFNYGNFGNSGDFGNLFLARFPPAPHALLGRRRFRGSKKLASALRAEALDGNDPSFFVHSSGLGAGPMGFAVSLGKGFFLAALDRAAEPGAGE